MNRILPHAAGRSENCLKFSMAPKGIHPRMGVREVFDGIFLYTTRVLDAAVGAGPMFIFEVESARADRMGVNFGIDFSGSTNFVLLPSVVGAATPTTTVAKPQSAYATSVATASADGPNKTPRKGETGAATTVLFTTAANADHKAGEAGGGSGTREGQSDRTEKGQEIAGSANRTRTSSDGNTTIEGDSSGDNDGETQNAMTARVSTQAFCRVVVARLIVRDPKLGGTMKTSYSWELLEPPPLSAPSQMGNEGTRAPADGVGKTADTIQQELHSSESLELDGDGGEGRRRKAGPYVEEIVKRCRMHGILYVDQNFPPNDSSLGQSLAASGFVTWCRLGTLSTGMPWCKVTATSRGITAFDTTTTAFGGYGRPFPSDVRACPFAVDASLSCALAALAERPRLVSAALCGRVEETFSSAPVQNTSDVGQCHDVGRDGKGFLVKSDLSCLKGVDGKAKERREMSSKQSGKRVQAKAAAATAAMAFAAASQSGIFSARLCVDGVWKEYVTDDYFPCIATPGGPDSCTNGGLCLSRAHGPALWVSMLEKAYARAMGSYSTALGGCCLSSDKDKGEAKPGSGVAVGAGNIPASVIARPAKVLGAFTGAPVLQAEIVGGNKRAGGTEAGGSGDGCQKEQAQRELWASIVAWVQQGWLVSLSTPPVVPLVENLSVTSHRRGYCELWKDSLRLGYAYTVLQAAEIGSGNKLLWLRGPLPATDGWEGEWADDSPSWTPEAMCLRFAIEKRHLDGSEESAGEGRGTFWISIAEAVSAFVEVGVCMTPSSPHLGRGSPSEGLVSRRNKKYFCSHGWAREVRRRVVFARRGASMQRKGRSSTVCSRGEMDATSSGQKETWDKNNESDADLRCWWASSQIYALSVYETSSMFFSLHQETRATNTKGSYRNMGVTVLRLREGCRPEPIASTGNPAQGVVSTGAVLSPGRYVVVPSYCGSVAGSTEEEANSLAETTKSHPLGKFEGHCPQRLPPTDGDIMKPKPGKEMTVPGLGREDKGEEEGEAKGISFDSPEILSGLMEMFKGLDADCDGLLSREELDAYLRTTEGFPLQDDVYTWLVRTFSSCLRPPGVDSTSNFGGRKLRRRVGTEQPQRHQRRVPRAPAGIETCDDSGMSRDGGVIHAPLGAKQDVDSDLCLTRRGFLEMYRSIWQTAGRDVEVVIRDLLFTGCVSATTRPPGKKKQLSAAKRSYVVISVHSDTEIFDLVAQPPDRELLEAALTLPVQRWGYLSSPHPRNKNENNGHDINSREGVNTDTTVAVTDSDYGDKHNKGRNIGEALRSAGCVRLHVRPGPKGAENAVTFVAQNASPGGRGGAAGGAVRVHLDCAGSENASAMPGSHELSREVTLLPGQLKVIQHLVPADPQKPWSWKHSPATVQAL